MKYLVIGGYSITLEIDDFGCVNSDIFVSTYMTRTIYENENYSQEEKQELITMGLRAISGKEVD